MESGKNSLKTLDTYLVLVFEGHPPRHRRNQGPIFDTTPKTHATVLAYGSPGCGAGVRRGAESPTNGRAWRCRELPTGTEEGAYVGTGSLEKLLIKTPLEFTHLRHTT